MRGFTLLELLVVIAVMAISAIFIIPNLGKSTDDQRLKNVAEELQTLIRQAQNNATSGSKCFDSSGQEYRSKKWQTEFIIRSGTVPDKYVVKCAYDVTSDGSVVTFLQQVKEYAVNTGFIVDKIEVNNCAGTNVLSTGTRPLVSFGNISGSINFGCYVPGTPDSACTNLTACGAHYSSSTFLFDSAKITITVKSNQSSSTKDIVIEKGGAVYVQ